MTRPYNLPFPHRFRTWEDASKFVATSDLSLCVPSHIEKDTPHGKRLEPNPEYKSAPWELNIVPVEVYGKVVKRNQK